MRDVGEFARGTRSLHVNVFFSFTTAAGLAESTACRWLSQGSGLSPPLLSGGGLAAVRFPVLWASLPLSGSRPTGSPSLIYGQATAWSYHHPQSVRVDRSRSRRTAQGGRPASRK